MDTRLKQALEFSNYRQTLNNQLQELKIRAKTSLTVSKNGGSFIIDRSFLNFIKLLVDEKQIEAVILDRNETPILITDLGDLYTKSLSLYSEVTNDYYAQYEKIRKQRSVKKIIDFEEAK